MKGSYVLKPDIMLPNGGNYLFFFKMKLCADDEESLNLPGSLRVGMSSGHNPHRDRQIGIPVGGAWWVSGSAGSHSLGHASAGRVIPPVSRDEGFFPLRGQWPEAEVRASLGEGLQAEGRAGARLGASNVFPPAQAGGRLALMSRRISSHFLLCTLF